MDSNIDQWAPIPQDMPDLLGANVPGSANDWEQFLRWEEPLETMSPNTSSKDSTDSPTQDSSTIDTFSWLDGNATLAPPLIMGDDSSFSDFSSGMDPSSLSFSAQDQSLGPYVFGEASLLQPIAESLHADIGKGGVVPWPLTEAPSQPLEPSNLLSAATARRKSSSSAGTSPVNSHMPSPVSHVQTHSSASSLSPQPAQPPKKRAGRKRKSEMAAGDATGTGSGEGEPPIKKTSHNVIEKRYRNNLNEKIMELRNSVPSLRAMARPNGEEDDSEELDGLTPAHKLNKSTIMAKATEYIRHLEKRNKTMADEIVEMKERLSSLEQAYARNPVASIAPRRLGNQSIESGDSTAHLLDTSEQLRQRNAASLQTMPAFDTQMDEDESKQKYVKGHGGSGVMGKLMVGSMAALMVMEGVSEHDQGSSTGSRGLFAAPVHLLKRGLLSGPTGASSITMAQAALPLLKLSLILTALVYLVLPLFQPKPKKKVHTRSHITLTAAPSLAASVEVKRKAWLTAIQSVWTPRHFLVEVVLVTVRMIELSLRRIIGFDRYAELLGMTKDDEAARQKAWDIAVDAQLAGGDVEVSYYRLLLTLMASGTLPDSPIRLMQKAVHFRIFFWELANAGYGNLFMFKDFTAHVARVYWDSARNLQRGLVDGTASKYDELNHTVDGLPDHLAKLIELECDEVLTDDMIQRAYNLAWNRPSAENTHSNATLDTVVNDPAVRSPLDAIAAWFTNTIVDEALALSLHEPSGEVADDVEYLTSLAARTAPPASSTLTRSLVARAVMVNETRNENITAALESMPHGPLAGSVPDRQPTTGHLNMVDHVPLTPEICTTLTLAKVLGLADEKSSTAAKVHATRRLDGIAIPTKNFTLLTAVATFKVLELYGRHEVMDAGKVGLEKLAGNLRIWVGTRAGRTSCLSGKEKGMVVRQCISTTKRIGGWKDEAEDSGYGSELSRRGSGEQVAT